MTIRHKIYNVSCLTVPLLSLFVVGCANSTKLKNQINDHPTLSEEIYFTSRVASGEILCDRNQAAIQKRRFDTLYSGRIKRLFKEYYKSHATDPSVVHTDTCISGVTEAKLRQYLHDFSEKLKKLENRYE